MTAPNIKTASTVVPMIYAYTTPGVTYHDGWTKIGYTEQNVEARIRQQTHTADIRWKLEWKGSAIFDDGSGAVFRDSDFHFYLKNKGFEQEAGVRNEWFKISATDSQNEFYTFRRDRGILKSDESPVSYRLREEQTQAVEQAKELAIRGYREIVVTGIEIAGWGKDLPGKPPVSELIRSVCEAVPQLRVRLGSLEPRIVTEEFCRELAKYPNLCPQFHLSMQSGCDSVLLRMKRKYDTERYFESLELLRRFFPGCAITTDMIVAFPGETEEEFAESLAFIRRCRFADMHIFP